MIDLGHEPPLSVDGSEAAVIDRRRVSVQWFSGTILTGLCGAALIGGAVFASLDGETTFARVPERVESALRGAFGANDRTASLHKSDRLPPPGVYDRIVQEVERPLISICLAATRGNQIRAAQLLGLNRNTLRKKIRDLGLEVIRGLRAE